MANFRMAEVPFAGKKILYVVADDAMLRGTKMQELFDKYQVDDQVVFVDVPNRSFQMHQRNGELMQQFNRMVDTTRLPFGPVQTI